MKEKTRSLKYISDKSDLKGLYDNMIKTGFQCKVAFNIIMILAGKRKAYLFDNYRSHRFLIEGMIKHLENLKFLKYQYYHYMGQFQHHYILSHHNYYNQDLNFGHNLDIRYY